MRKLDAAFKNRELVTFLLHTGNDWTFTMVEGEKPPTIYDRSQFIDQTARTFAATQNVVHSRKIDHTDVSGDGRSAEITSEETTIFTVDGKPQKFVEHSVDDIEIEHASLVLTKSSSMAIGFEGK